MSTNTLTEIRNVRLGKAAALRNLGLNPYPSRSRRTHYAQAILDDFPGHDGKPVTVAIFDHPKNLRHPAKMFTMSTPFAYLSATCNVWKEPITIKAGKPLDLRYGVAVWDGEVEKTAVARVACM